jgi:uncharacterized protein YggE
MIMKTKILLAVGVVVMLVMVSLAGCSAKGVSAATVQPVNLAVSNQQTGIWVNGVGKITVTPDLAMLTLGVSSQTNTVAEAQANAATAMDKIMKALADQGVAKNDIQTNYFNIQQVTRWDDKSQIQVVIGYMVSNTVNAKLKDMEKVGRVIDAVVVAGGDLTRINGINFSVEKPEKLYQQVRELAMKDAKAKADQIASLSGVTLGKPTYVVENTYSPVSYQPTYLKMDAVAGGAAPSTAISAGEMDISLNVQVAYAIQ